MVKMKERHLVLMHIQYFNNQKLNQCEICFICPEVAVDKYFMPLQPIDSPVGICYVTCVRKFDYTIKNILAL